MKLKQFIPENKEQIIVGVIGGIVLSIIGLLLINMLFWSLPTNPAVYSYDYPNGTDFNSPYTQTSVDGHAQSVALHKPNYTVEYSEQLRINSENRTINNIQITYQINNTETKGNMSVLKQQRKSRLNSSLVTVMNQSISANNTTTSITSHLKNNTTQKYETGSEPILLQNQLRLPKTYVTQVNYINWVASSQKSINGDSVIVYEPKSVDTSNSPLSNITSINGELRVNTETSIITYNVTITGDMMVDGETKTVTHTQKYTYTTNE